MDFFLLLFLVHKIFTWTKSKTKSVWWGLMVIYHYIIKTKFNKEFFLNQELLILIL